MNLYCSEHKLVLPKENILLKRIFRKPIFEHYKRLFFIVSIFNFTVLFQGVFLWDWWNPNNLRLDLINNMIIGNFFAAILIRQQLVVNFLFWAATRAPTSWPLRIRWTLGKVYHFGGIHSGAATMGTLWYLIYLGSIFQHWLSNYSVSLLTLSSACVLACLLVFICIMALPNIRTKFHNYFELVHRFGGWSALVLFWLSSTSVFLDKFGSFSLIEFFAQPQIWLLTIITISVALPWLRLKKVNVEQLRPSNHVVLSKFNYGVTPFPGSSTSLSRKPLIEWHAFANVPSPNEEGFRLTISRAGDWTGQYIDDLPKKVWVKGVPTAGVANIEVLFKRVIYIATGSGIGPCLPHLLAKQVPSLLVWSTRTPEKTYGEELVNTIKQVQPNAIIWDTTEQGKPNMVELAYRAYREFNAEAVICISNQKLTNEVVYGMESRGIPAYGAIWDS